MIESLDSSQASASENFKLNIAHGPNYTTNEKIGKNSVFFFVAYIYRTKGNCTRQSPKSIPHKPSIVSILSQNDFDARQRFNHPDNIPPLWTWRGQVFIFLDNETFVSYYIWLNKRRMNLGCFSGHNFPIT